MMFSFWDHPPIISLLLFLLLPAVFAQETGAAGGYGAYPGIPVEGINGAGIAGNGADAAEQREDAAVAARGTSIIRKAPIAPVAPPRVPLTIPFGEDDEAPTRLHREPPPPTRREARSEGQCQFDPIKWRIHPQSATANAIMFDRTSGLSCDECLQLCANKYQSPSNPWICRSLTYDHRWRICDLFAVNGSGTPYFLVDYKGRDFFDYLAALPPTDQQLKGQHSAAAENSVRGDENEGGGNSNNLVVAQRDAPGEAQCLCPCKVLADKTAKNGLRVELPAATEGEKGTASAGGGNYSASVSAAVYSGAGDDSAAESGNYSSSVSSAVYSGAGEGTVEEAIGAGNGLELFGNGSNSEIPQQLPLAPDDIGTTTAPAEAPIAVPEEGSPSPPGPSPESASPVPLDLSALFTASPPPSVPEISFEIATTNNNASSGNPIGGEILSSESTTTTTAPTESSSASGPSSDPVPTPSSPSSLPMDDVSSLAPSDASAPPSDASPPPPPPPPPTPDTPSSSSSSPSPPQISLSSEDDSSLLSSGASSSSSASPEATPPSSNSSGPSADGHRALSSKTYQQPFREVRVPFHKTLAKMNRMASAALKQRPQSKAHEVPRACPKKGQRAHYVEVAEYRRLLTARRGGAATVEEIGAKDAGECQDACDAPIKLTTCNSAVFSASHRCELSASAANHSAPDSLVAAPKFKYMEKICLDGALSRGDKRHIFPAVIGHILVGHVQEVFNAGSLSECIKACLLAESSYGFVCKSVMFYPTDTDQNCLMNSESKHSQSDVFVQEDPNVHMLYVDIEQPRMPPAPLPLAEDEERRFKDIPIDGGDKKDKIRHEKEGQSAWTRWSMCLTNGTAESAAEMRHRYLKCREAKDVRKCPKESIPCKKLTKPLRIQQIGRTMPEGLFASTDESSGKSNSECLAVRDALGLKRCPYGMRWNGMQREFCSKPVDC